MTETATTTDAATDEHVADDERLAAVTATVDAHLEAYGEPDADRRGQIVARVWDPTGRLVDPPIDGTGHDGIVELAGTVQTMFPGHTFRRTTVVDEHHGHARYGWDLLDPEGTAVLSGVDVALLGDDGRLLHVAGFFGELTPLT